MAIYRHLPGYTSYHRRGLQQNPLLSDTAFQRTHGSLQVFLSADIISAYSIENIRIAQISDIVSDSLMIGRDRICRQCITDIVGGCQIRYIIHHELFQMLQHRCVRQMIFRDQIPIDDRIIHVSEWISIYFLSAASSDRSLKERVGTGDIQIIFQEECRLLIASSNFSTAALHPRINSDLPLRRTLVMILISGGPHNIKKPLHIFWSFNIFHTVTSEIEIFLKFRTCVRSLPEFPACQCEQAFLVIRFRTHFRLFAGTCP